MIWHVEHVGPGVELLGRRGDLAIGFGQPLDRGDGFGSGVAGLAAQRAR
jgi:hypothetical protein